MRIVEVEGVEIKIPSRYQDNRKAWKKVSEVYNRSRGFYPPAPIKPRKEEFKIPIQIDRRTTVYVRESRIFKPKWVNYFDSKEELEKYIEDYKNLTNGTKDTI